MAARDYTLTSRRPPAKLFWSATVYDVATRCLIDNEQQRGDRGSRDADLGTTPTAPSTCTSARPPPPAGRRTGSRPSPANWFSYFRLYGPLEPYFDRTWKLADITPTT